MTPLSSGLLRTELAKVDHGIFGATLYYFQQVGSTNDIAREYAEERYIPEGSVIVTDEQTEGRGRLGRQWVAPPQTSILMSVLFRPSFAPDQANRLVMACGMAIVEACEEMLGVAVNVKWPNDLLIGQRKFTGMLAESAIDGERLAWVTVGMGINVNQRFSEDDALAETATSLLMECGEEVDRAALVARILAGLDRWHVQLQHSVLVDSWRGRCVTLGQHVHIQSNATQLQGYAEELDEVGALWLRDQDGVRHRVTAGEATILQ